MLIDATMQSKNPKNKHKERPQTEHQQRHQKGPNGAPRKVPKNTFGRQPVHGKVGQFRLSLSPCALCKKNTIRDHKRSTRETRGFAKTEHQQAQSESTNEAPESTIRDHKRSTSRDPEVLPERMHQASPYSEITYLAPESTTRDHKPTTRETRGFAKTEHQQVQSESTNEAPESTIRDHKRSTRETRGFAKTEHQQVRIREHK